MRAQTRGAREGVPSGGWSEALAALEAADVESGLGADDLERLALYCYLTARDAESVEAWARAHAAHLDSGELARAARCAFWNGMTLMLRGQTGPAAGWFGTAVRSLEDVEGDVAERGLLLVVDAVQQLMRGEPRTAKTLADQAAAIAEDDDSRTAAAYGANFARLRSVKAAYDPDNVFRVNRNISPAR